MSTKIRSLIDASSVASFPSARSTHVGELLTHEGVQTGKLRRLMAIPVGLVLLSLAVVAFFVLGSDDPRRIDIVAKNMMFNATNPTFQVSPGETVEFHLINDDPGMNHDFAIPELGVTTGRVPEGGEASVVVTFPERSATYQYHCSYHPVTMIGQVLAQ